MGQKPEEFYDEYGEEEWKRSKEHPTHSIEYENTISYLEDYLPEEGRILDAGGGAGTYSVWLAERGYDVVLLDISRKQLEVAEKKLEERGLSENVRTVRGDIRDLQFDDESFNAILCLSGPLSHVVEDDARRKSAEELVRVAKSRAPVFVSVMGFYAVLMIHVLKGWSFIREYEDFLRRQKYDEKHRKLAGEEDPGFAETFFFKPEQLRKILRESGLEVEKIVGLENVSSVWEAKSEDDTRRIDPGYQRKLMEISGELKDDKASPFLSSHILGVGKKQ